MIVRRQPLQLRMAIMNSVSCRSGSQMPQQHSKATEEEHLKRLDMVLERITKANLTLKPSKCQWLRNSVKFLGHIVSKEGVAVDPAKVRSVSSFPILLNKSDVRSFLGMTSYYRRFILDFASRSKHLAELTKKKCLSRWTEDAQKAFEDLKSCLTTTPILRCPDFRLPFKLYTDACDYGIGSVLAQETSDGEVVVAYASRLLKSSERKYAVLQKEALEAETVARKLVEFIHIYGIPEQLLSDRGSQFTSALMKALCKQLGVKKIFTCSFRPSSNGLNQHSNGTLFNGVKMYASRKPSTWDEYLDAVTFAYRTTPRSVTQHTPAFLVFGRDVNSTIDMKPPTRLYSDEYVKVMQNERQQAYSMVKELVAKEQQRQKRHYDEGIKEIEVNVGEKVWLRDFVVNKNTSKKFHQPWQGPYEVTKIIGENNVELQIKENKTKRVNMEQTKLASEIEGNPEDIIKVHDKLRSRLPGQRLVTRYFVEFQNGKTQWVDSTFVPDVLLEEFDAAL
eukprot:gene19624-biopygen13894